MKKIFLLILPLLAIVSIGVFFRLYKLHTLPYGFFCDEANIGVSAYSLLHTGKDEHGATWPIFFQGFGDWRLPIPIYTQIPIISLLGLSVFSVRLTTVIWGIVCILLMYKIGCLWIDKQFGLIMALLFAVSPWAIHMSRNGMEWSYPLPFLLFAIYAFSKSHSSEVWFLLGAASSALTSYTYYAAVFIAPVFFIFHVLYFLWKISKKRFVFLGGMVYILLLLPLIFGILDNKVTSRFKTVIQASDQTKSITQQIPVLALTYIRHFDPDFLFFHQIEREFITRHAVRGVGEVPRYGALFIPIGILYCLFFFRSEKKRQILLSTWSLFFLFPLGGIMNENHYPIATRGILGVIPMTILLAFGFYGVLRLATKQRVLFITLLCILLGATGYESKYFYQKYFHDYPLYASDYWGWQSGPEEVIAYYTTHQRGYDDLFLTGYFNAPFIFIPFFDVNHRCPKCQLGNIEAYNSERRQLFAVREEDFLHVAQVHPDLQFVEIKKIRLPNGKPELFIGRFIQKTK